MNDPNNDPQLPVPQSDEPLGGRSLYDAIGGEAMVRKLVEIFYDIVEFEPEGRLLNDLHRRGHGVAHSRTEQFKFLSGFLGGPQLYVEQHGHSNVRQMHEHVEIDATARDTWLLCMSTAIEWAGISAEHKLALLDHFRKVAHLVTNR